MRPAYLSIVTLITFLVPLVEALTFTEHHSRSTTDVCGNVNSDLIVKLPPLDLPVHIGSLDFCFCLSNIPDLLTSQSVCIEAVKKVGQSQVKDELTSMINDASDHKKCTYPDHCSPICSHGDPCGFSCTDGFTPSPPEKPTECICEKPNRVCNDKCGWFPGYSCPSGTPKKRELDIKQKRAICDMGETACGVYGWLHSSEAWECVDTMRDLESCGGCTIPFGSKPAHGIDCTSIPGVMDVACSAGSCIIERCLPGYMVSLDRSFCARLHDLVAEIPAAEYGLEHIPLKRAT